MEIEIEPAVQNLLLLICKQHEIETGKSVSFSKMITSMIQVIHEDVFSGR